MPARTVAAQTRIMMNTTGTGFAIVVGGISADMEYLLTIPGTLNNLNDYIAAERANRYKGAKMKADNGNIVAVAIRRCMRGVRIRKPVSMEYLWVEPNRRRDKDNISSFGRKVIQDALVDAGVLEDDGWDYVAGFSDRFEVDKQHPRIEVTIVEVGSD